MFLSRVFHLLNKTKTCLTPLNEPSELASVALIDTDGTNSHQKCMKHSGSRALKSIWERCRTSQGARIPHGCLITWRTWFPDSFSPFAERKCSNSLQSVCFDLSKRKQRRVSTRNKCDCEMSPAAQYDELQFYVNLPTCSNGLFTLRSVRNLLGPFAHMHIWILKSDRSTLLFPTLINAFKGLFFSYLVCCQLKMHLQNNASQWKINCAFAHAFIMTLWICRPVFAVVHLKVEFWLFNNALILY